MVLILVPLLFAAGYALSAGGTGEKLRQWFGIGEITAPPDEEKTPDTPGETGDEDPGGELSEPQPGQDEPGKPHPGTDNPGKEPVIYAGQVLTIPVTGGAGSSVSKVITSGTVPSASGNKQIALTFDSGWEYVHTIPLLDVLDHYGIKATFFPRALWLKDHQDLGREIVRRGHTMGNHSLTHSKNMSKMSAADFRTEMRQSTQIIQDICGVRPYLFRPPDGENYNNQLLSILAEEGYPYTIMWTIDTLDWAAGNTRNVGGQQTYIDVDFIVNRVLMNSDSKKNNGIVLMHIGGNTAGHLTVSALPRIIDGLRSQGYSFTTVDRMLPPPGSSGQVTHTVESGDTLYRIARRYGVSAEQIIDANNL